MSLSRIKMLADNFDGVDIQGNHYSMASNTVEIYPGTLKQPLNNNEEDEFDIEVYIAPGTKCATYTTTLHFFSDDNNNNILDPNEISANVELKVYVKATEKVKEGLDLLKIPYLIRTAEQGKDFNEALQADRAGFINSARTSERPAARRQEADIGTENEDRRIPDSDRGPRRMHPRLLGLCPMRPARGRGARRGA